MIDATELPVVGYCGSIVEAVPGIDETHYHRDARRMPHDHIEVFQVIRYKLWLEEEVLGGISGDSHLRETDELNLHCLCSLDVTQDLGGVTFEVTHGAVDLSQAYSKSMHGKIR